MKFQNNPWEVTAVLYSPRRIEGVGVRYQNPTSLNLKQMEIKWLNTILKDIPVLCSNLFKITISPVVWVDSIYTTYFNFEKFCRFKIRTCSKGKCELNLDELLHGEKFSQFDT